MRRRLQVTFVVSFSHDFSTSLIYFYFFNTEVEIYLSLENKTLIDYQ